MSYISVREELLLDIVNTCDYIKKEIEKKEKIRYSLISFWLVGAQISLKKLYELRSL